MSVNGITNLSQAYETKDSAKTKASKSQKSDSSLHSSETAAAVYEKSSQSNGSNKIYKPDMETIDRLKEDAERRTESLRSLVEKMFLEQGKAFTDSTDIYAALREGKLNIDPEVSAQAQKDLADDGYWGVEQTSERLLSFAKALSGGDVSKANVLIDAVLQGFSEATKAWGGELPDICKRTIDVTIKKMEAWRDGIQYSDKTDEQS